MNQTATSVCSLATLRNEIDSHAVGEEMYRLIEDLYPICRSITGDGVRQTLRILGEHIPLEVHEVVSGTPVFDWVVPKEWNIRDAYVKNAAGERVIDFREHNLHVLNYSVPVKKTVSLAELREHLFASSEHPEQIPYRTSYYKENWGFCVSQKEYDALEEGQYEVCIDSSLADGHLTYGECYLPGDSEQEVFFSAHVCHPSLANDNLSGIALSVALAHHLAQVRRHYSYRFVFAPGTIGAITWLARNEDRVSHIRHGLIFACVGDRVKAVYKRSRRGAEIDAAVEHVLRHASDEFEILPFSPYGYDERQYCSPGFDLPMGCLMKSPPGSFEEYHTSADNLDLVRPAFLADSFRKCLDIICVLEGNGRYLNRNPKCEPMLGKRGLYGAMGGTERKATEMAMLWVLNYSDGNHTLLDIAETANIPFARIREAAELLCNGGLLEIA